MRFLENPSDLIAPFMDSVFTTARAAVGKGCGQRVMITVLV